jgi:Flp pilus assembly protein TadB
VSKRTLTIVNIAALATMLVGVLNLIVFREIWILAVAMIVVVALMVYSVREKRKLSKAESS